MALLSSKGKLTRDSFTGWFMAAPAMALIGLFLITPFLLGLGFSFTNQRLTSPNPTEFVGVENYTRLLGIGVLKLEPEREADGSLKQDADGATSYPRIRTFTRNNPDYPHLDGMREYKSFSWGENQIVILARDVVFLTALVNTLSFVAVVAPVQAALALFLALLVNQKIPGVTIFRAVYFMPVVLSVVVVALLWRFIYAADNGLLNSLLSYMSFGLFPVGHSGHVRLAGGRFSHGHMAFRPANYLSGSLRGSRYRRREPLAEVQHDNLAAAAQHDRANYHRHYHAGFCPFCADRCDDQGRPPRFDAKHRLSGG